MPLNQITPLVGIPLSQIWGPLVLVFGYGEQHFVIHLDAHQVNDPSVSVESPRYT